MYVICGIDASTHTGVTVMSQTNNLLYTKVYNARTKGLIGARGIANHCLQICNEYKVTHIFIESVAWNAKNKIVLDMLATLNVVIRNILFDVAPLFLVPPLCLKKYITGNGRATKKQVSVSLKRQWYMWHKNSNGRDALSLALCGYGFLTNNKGPFNYDLSTKITQVI